MMRRIMGTRHATGTPLTPGGGGVKGGRRPLHVSLEPGVDGVCPAVFPSRDQSIQPRSDVRGKEPAARTGAAPRVAADGRPNPSRAPSSARGMSCDDQVSQDGQLIFRAGFLDGGFDIDLFILLFYFLSTRNNNIVNSRLTESSLRYSRLHPTCKHIHLSYHPHCHSCHHHHHHHQAFCAQLKSKQSLNRRANSDERHWARFVSTGVPGLPPGVLTSGH